MKTLWLAVALALVGCTQAPEPLVKAKVSEVEAPAVQKSVSSSKLPLPQVALHLIADSEVSADPWEGWGYYIRHYQIATRPQDGSSGPTIGIGVDAGQQKASYTRKCWSPYLPADQVARLAACSGVIGWKADPLVARLQDIVIPPSIAWPEFLTYEIPNYMDQCEEAWNGYDDLRNNAQGALCSLGYNRGFSMVGDSRSEMREIRSDVPKADYDDIAYQIRHMERLWRGTNEGKGLIIRREAEAKLVLTP